MCQHLQMVIQDQKEDAEKDHSLEKRHITLMNEEQDAEGQHWKKVELQNRKMMSRCQC